MKIKKVIIGFCIVIGLVIVSIIVIPMIFKDEIQQAIDEQLEANVNADVLYNIDNFNVSLISNFPNITIGVKELGVIGRDQFEGEVLFAIQEFEAEVNIWKLIFGGETRIQGIYLTEPQIFIKVLEDGTANYDIAISSGDDEEIESTESSDFNMAIDRWEISNGHLIYDDATMPMFVELKELNHSGSGNFSLSVFDLNTTSSAFASRISYDGLDYLNNRELNLDMIINMDLDKMKFVFKENRLAINDFAIGVNGWVAMPNDDIDMDLTLETQNNSFKSLISLVPAIYLTDFDQLESSGNLQFNAAIAGTYSETKMPAFNVDLNVKDGMFHYPELPEAISNVQINMNVESSDGNIDNTRVDISKFHIDFGKEPFDGYLKIDNLVNYPIDLAINTTLNLENVTNLFPVEGMKLEGQLAANVKAKGTYDSIANTIPLIEAKMTLSSGKIEYTDLPSAIENINIALDAVNSTGQINDTKLTIPKFGLTLDGQPISGNLLIEDLDDVHWIVELSGDLNFDKLFPLIDEFYPLPGTTLSGDVVTEVHSEGRMSDVDSERYSKLKTSGSMVFKNFLYTDSLLLPMGLKIESGSFSFSPEAMNVEKIKTEVGRSDFEFNGKISNYISYLFEDDVIRGNLSMISNKVDVNEFMVTDETEAINEAESDYELIEVRNNIDFVFQASLTEVIYDNLNLSDATGEITVKNGVLNLNGLKTSTLGGIIVFDGKYSTSDPKAPAFSMSLNVSNIEISDAYSAFNTVKILAPIAKDVDGKVSTLFKLNGNLQSDMMPMMESLQGEGRLKILEATLADSEIVKGITSYVKGNTGSLSLANLAMYVKIQDGKLAVQPFNLKINNVSSTIAGETGLDGSIDYKLKLEVPAGKFGSQMNSLVGNISDAQNETDVISLNLGLQGTYLKPQFILLSSNNKEVAKKAAVNQLTKLAGGDQNLADSLSNVNVNDLVEEQKKMAEAELKKQQDSLKKAAAVEAEKAKKKALDEANKQLKNLFGPKKKKN